jgi:hypothetical protein
MSPNDTEGEGSKIVQKVSRIISMAVYAFFSLPVSTILFFFHLYLLHPEFSLVSEHSHYVSPDFSGLFHVAKSIGLQRSPVSGENALGVATEGCHVLEGPAEQQPDLFSIWKI